MEDGEQVEGEAVEEPVLGAVDAHADSPPLDGEEEGLDPGVDGAEVADDLPFEDSPVADGEVALDARGVVQELEDRHAGTRDHGLDAESSRLAEGLGDAADELGFGILRELVQLRAGFKTGVELPVTLQPPLAICRTRVPYARPSTRS